MPRFFVEPPITAKDNAIILPAEAAHHAGRALRLAEGECVTVFDGLGQEFSGQIHFDGKEVSVLNIRASAPLRETPVRYTLIQSLVSPDKLDWIVEKATEAGVSRIVLVPAQRSVTKLNGERLEKRLQKLTAIARAACEQCTRNIVPDIEAAPSLAYSLSNVKSDVRIMLAPGAMHPASIAQGSQSVAFAVGPEGGFSGEEIALAHDAGWQSALLGPRILRTETAGLAAIIWANTLVGDFPH